MKIERGYPYRVYKGTVKKEDSMTNSEVIVLKLDKDMNKTNMNKLKKLFNKVYTFSLKELKDSNVFDLDNVIFYENMLYEKFYDEKNKKRFRVIYNSDDYDYLYDKRDRNLIRRLNRL